MATTKEIAWAAGLVEGEGCIVAGVFGHKCTKQIRLVVEMSDYDVIKRLADIFQVTAIRHKAGRSAKHHDTYVFSLTGVRLRGWLMTIYVFLGERRRLAVRAALNMWKRGWTPRRKKL